MQCTLWPNNRNSIKKSDRLCFIIWFIGLLMCNVAFALDPLNIRYPDIPVPSGSNWSWVGRQMVVDGVPMSVKTFEYKGAEAQLIAHFENAWKTQGHGAYRRNQIGPKQTLSYETPDFYTTVQYQIEGSVIAGSISVSPHLNQAFKQKKSYISAPIGAKLMSHVESNDLGRYSETQIFVSNKNVSFNADLIDGEMKNAGWVAIDKRCLPSSCVIQYQSQMGLLQISIKDIPGKRSKGSRILVHLIKH